MQAGPILDAGRYNYSFLVAHLVAVNPLSIAAPGKSHRPESYR